MTLFNRNITYTVIDLLLLSLVAVAWISATHGKPGLLDVASLLGVVAFNLMWAHYVVDALTPKKKNETDNWHYYASRIAVLVAILAHPFLVNWYLIANGYGWPPTNYGMFLGTLAWAVILGIVALVVFLLFEARHYFAKYKRPIHHANIIAMFLVFIHGFLIGMVIMNTWYIWIWWILLFGFTLVIVNNYRDYYKNNSDRKIIAYITIAIFVVLVGLAGYSATRGVSSTDKQSNETVKVKDNTKQNTTITLKELTGKNGLDGAECWVAVDGTVYNMAGIPEWQGGKHIPSEGKASCGRDLSDVIGQSPHGKSVLNELPVMGTLKK